MSRSSSAVVDSKVVEMTLENSNFEQNAAKSLSTLQKLKEALNFTNHKDGIDKFNGSLKKVDFDPINTGINTAREGISALDAVSFGFFSKIGSQIEQTAMKYANMFSGMKQAMDGFSEYELKMGSVQTILMGARTKEGLPVTLDMVNQKLDELNTYADKTIYSFSDMTASIGKFTNAGVDLDTAVAAIQGISNEAALSGANAQQASHAMYNFAQALSSGYVKLIDWKSIENANMATVDFKQTLIDTALELGTIEKQGDKFVSTTKDMSGKVSDAFDATTGFNDSLAHAWMNTDVLTKALGKYADEETEVGKKAFQAATEVKTFTQLIDTLQEAAGSGWAQTWELIVGDFDESKSLFTMLSNTFGGIIDAQAKTRNALLEEGLGAKKGTAVTEEYFKSLGMGAIQSNTLRKSLMELGKANGVAFKTNDARGFFESLDSGWLTVNMLRSKIEELNGVGTEGPDGMTKSLDEMREAALKVIKGGDDGYSADMAERFKQLTEDGFDPDKIQAYVNEIHKLAGGTWNVTDAIMEEAAANVGLNETMTKSSGLFDDILDKVQPESSGKTGRELLFDALKTSLWSFMKIAGTVKMAWRDVFPPATGEAVYKIAEGLNNASKALRHFAIQNAERIRIVFMAIFNILDLILRTGKAVIKEVFGGLKKAFSGGGDEAGSFIEKVAKLINKFHDWVVENEIIEKAVGKIGDAIGYVITTIGSWIDAIGKIPQVQNILTSFGETFGWIGKNIGPIFEKAGGKLSLFGGRVARAFENADSPEEFFKRIKAAFDGLWSDIYSSETFGKIKDSFKVLGENIKSFINELGNNEDGTRNTFGKILDAVSNFRTKFMQILSGVDENGEKIDVFKGIKEAFTGLWDDLSASGIGDKIKGAFDTVKEAIDNFFTSIGTNSDGSLNAFGRIYEALKNAFDWISQKAGAAKTAIVDFFNQYHLGEFFSNVWGDISKGVGDFFTSLPEFVSGAKGKFGEFIEKVKGLGGIRFDNLGEIWQAFKDTVGQYFKDNDVFKPISDAFSNIKDKIVTKLQEMGVDILGIRDKIVGFFTGIKDAIKDFSLPDAFQKLVDFFVGKKDEVAEGAESVGNGIGGFFENIRKWIAGNDLASTITKIVGAIMLFKGAQFIVSLVKPIEQLISAMAAEKRGKANLMNKAAMLEMAAAFGIFAYIVAKLGELDVGTLVQGLIALGVLAAIIGAFSIVISKFADAPSMAAAGTMALEMAVAVGIMAYVVNLLGDMLAEDPGKMVKGALGLIALLAILIVVGNMMQSMNGMSTALSGGGILAMILSLYGFLLLINIIADMDLVKMLKGLGKVVLLGAALALIMFMLKKAVGSGLEISIAIVGLAACIIAIAAALWILSTIPTDKLFTSVIALAAVLGVLAVAFKMMENMGGSLGTMIGFAAVILVLSASIFALSLLDPKDLIAPTLAIGILLGLLALLAKSVPQTGMAMVGILLMVALIVAIGVVLYLLASLPNADVVAKIALGLGIIFAALGVAMYGAVAAGAAAPAALIGILIMIGAIAAFTLLAWALGSIAGDEGTRKAITDGIDIMVEVMTGLGKALGGFVGGLAEGAFSTLPAIGESITGFMRALEPLNEIGIVDPGPFLEALAAIAGASIAGAIDGVASFATELTTGKSSVELVADDMASLADGFAHYAEVMQQFDGIEIDTTALDVAISKVTRASISGLADGLASIITDFTNNESSVSLVAEDMGKLADGFANYATTMSRFDGITIDTAGLDNAISEVTKASLAGLADGLATLVTDLTGATEGESSVSLVASDMSALASGFSDYATTMSEFDGITIDTTALDDLIAVIGEISFQGLLTSLGNLILGDDEKSQVTQFSEDIGSLASALSEWQTQMDSIGNITVPVEQINSLATALDTVKTGGILDSVLNFFGADTSPDYSSFNEGIVGLGGAINEFSNSLGEDFNEEKLTTATDAIKKLSEVGVALGDVDFGGWFSDGVLTNFAEELAEIVPDLNSFAGQFEDVDRFSQIAVAVKQLASGAASLANVEFGNGDLTDDETVKNVQKNVNQMVSMIEGLSSINTSGVDKFTSSLEKINSAKISGAAQKIAEANKATASSGSNTGKQMSDSIAKGIDSSAISSAADKAVSSAMRNINVSGYSQIGSSISARIALGVVNSASRIKSSVSSAVTSAKNSLSNYQTSFYTAGKNFVIGLANGISQNRSSAINAAIDVAAKALAEAKARLKINSPSKATEEVGKFFDLGFAKGISDYSDRVYNESSSIASLAMRGIKQATDLASDILADELSDPVITPVLDLSEIQNGAGAISNLFNTSPMATLGNLSAIGQNAQDIREASKNDDILMALESLGGMLGNSSGNTYNINGVTYDDGSNVSSAVEQLIRAAKIERRA